MRRPTVLGDCFCCFYSLKKQPDRFEYLSSQTNGLKKHWYLSLPSQVVNIIRTEQGLVGLVSG